MNRADAPDDENELDLPPKQSGALRALLTCSRVTDAAAEAGVSERTLYRWLAQDEAFIRAYREARRALTANVVAALEAGAMDASARLRSIVNDEETTSAVATSAARVLLEMGPRWRDTHDLELRIADMERSLGDDEKGAG